MGLDDLARKAKEAWQHEKVQNALRSEKAEGASDSVLDKVADAANRTTGGKYADQVAGARQAADERIGTPAGARPSDRRGPSPTAETEPPSTPDPSTPEPERSPEPGTLPEPGTVPGAPGDPTVPPTTPPTGPPSRPTGPAGA
jgi:hypothetical protein